MATKTRGPKTPHTEVVCGRVEKKLAFAVRLAAEADRRRISDYIASVLNQAVRKRNIAEEAGGEVSAWDVADRVWDADPARRLLHQAFNFPETLTQHEANVWELIWHSSAFSRQTPPVSGAKLIDEAQFVKWDSVQKHWDDLQSVAKGEAPKRPLPKGEPINEHRRTVNVKGRKRG